MANSKCRWEAPNQWGEWSQWLAAGLHARNRWRLPVLLLGILFAGGRRTVTTWLRAAGVSDDWDRFYDLLISLGLEKFPFGRGAFLRQRARRALIKGFADIAV